jgi:hypothetical protein
MQADKGEVFDDSSLRNFRNTVQELANGLLKSGSIKPDK